MNSRLCLNLWNISISGFLGIFLYISVTILPNLRCGPPLNLFIANFVNENTMGAYKTLEIVIISQMIRIHGVWQVDMRSVFTKLGKKRAGGGSQFLMKKIGNIVTLIYVLKIWTGVMLKYRFTKLCK